jgi:hypothetical protein
MVMDRNEILRMFILDVIADDYENLEKIQNEVGKLGIRAGLGIEPPEITRELIGLIKSGLVRAYRLSPTQPVEEVQGVPPPQEVDGLYYWLTDEGKEIQLADYPHWPFDETGNLRRDWSPPVR